MSGPLSHIKVLEIAGIGPGPVAGMMLADLGADVITVERPPASPAEAQGAKSALFNRGKRSITLDLKQPEAVEAVLKLAETSDMLIEGFRPGVMERLGLGPDVCLARNPRLVFGRMTGWGQYGPLSHAAGHDPNYIALTGALWAGGDAHTPPTAPLTLVGDVGGGTMILIMGLLSACIHAGKTGEGQVIDAAITDGSAYISTLLRFMHNIGQIDDQPGSGWANFGAPWNRSYACADGGHIAICALEPKFYAELLDKLGLADNPLFANQWDKAVWPEATQALTALFASQPRDHWNALMEGSDACYAPVLNFTEALHHPHNVARETFLDIEGISQPAPAPKFSQTPSSAGTIPGLGSSTFDILSELGLSNEVIQQISGGSS